MKSTIYSILVISILAILVYSCEKDKTKLLTMTGKLISNSECKRSKSVDLKSDTPDSLTCIDYLFDISGNKLSIKHINAGFNCCPDSLYCNVSISNDTIIIQEFEKIAQCRCNCLYDLNIEIKEVETKKYQVKFIEPYSGEQAKLIFGLDLTKDKEGSYCITRKQYPWGE
jgi:hypothetical protein